MIADSNNGGDELMQDLDDFESLVKRRKLNSASPPPLSAADWVVVATLVVRHCFIAKFFFFWTLAYRFYFSSQDNEHETSVAPAGPVVPTEEDISKLHQYEQENAKLMRELMLERELRAKLLASLYVRTQEILVEENSYDLLGKQITMLTSTSVKLQQENQELHQTVGKLKAETEELKKKAPATLSGFAMTAEAQIELEKHKKALEVAIVYQQHQAMLAYAAQQQAQQWLMQQMAASNSESAVPVGAPSPVPGYHPSFVAAMQQHLQTQPKPAPVQAAN